MNEPAQGGPSIESTAELEASLREAGARFSGLAGAAEQRVVASFGDVSAEYEAIVAGAAVVDLGCRGRFEIEGADRASFLHNLCTNEIRKLPIGSGCEAFFLNVQGKIIGQAIVLCRPESLVIETVAGAAPGLIEHLERYHIREAVEMYDRGRQWCELLLAGPRAAELLAPLTGGAPPAGHFTGVETEFAGAHVSLWRVELSPLEGYLLLAPQAVAVALWQALTGAGARPAGIDALEIVRVEAGWPLFGRDITDRNLPQEVQRDDRAINFVKGCYLGQETVARIDALGHVNRLLAPVRFLGRELPTPGMALEDNGQAVGEVTSAVMSPRHGAPWALAYVRRGFHAPGTPLESAAGPCEVATLP